MYNAELFLDYALRYNGDPMDWDSQTIDYICLNIIPGKVSMEAKFFETCGEGIALFFQFLEKNNYLPQADTLRQHIEQIKDEIPKIAADPANWHMAKSMFMPAIEQGLDISDKDTLNHFMRHQQVHSLN